MVASTMLISCAKQTATRATQRERSAFHPIVITPRGPAYKKAERAREALGA